MYYGRVLKLLNRKSHILTHTLVQMCSYIVSVGFEEDDS